MAPLQSLALLLLPVASCFSPSESMGHEDLVGAGGAGGDPNTWGPIDPTVCEQVLTGDTCIPYSMGKCTDEYCHETKEPYEKWCNIFFQSDAEKIACQWCKEKYCRDTICKQTSPTGPITVKCVPTVRAYITDFEEGPWVCADFGAINTSNMEPLIDPFVAGPCDFAAYETCVNICKTTAVGQPCKAPANGMNEQQLALCDSCLAKNDCAEKYCSQTSGRQTCVYGKCVKHDAVADCLNQ